MFLSLTATGCGSSVPGCSDAETKELVFKIVRDELTDLLGAAEAAKANLQLEAIRTQSVDEKTGACSCAAELRVRANGVDEKVPITYTSEKTDKGDEFYVTVYGL